MQDGQIAGTTGQGLRLEALRIFIIKPGADSKNSAKIGTINNNGKQISYTYDANGNIQTITENGKTIKYTYNELNEVTREDNAVLNKTIVYTYDAGGNIRTKVEYAYTTGTLGAATKTINYGYGDSNWKDKLTSYNGKNISYDAIGNPLNDGTYSYTWEEGRQLKTISGGGKSISYKYNDAGIRTQKVVNGVTTNYHLEGDKVTYESNGTDKIYYTYDSEGDLISMNLNGTEYYYIRNAQGDIIGLFDKAGTQVVAYTYDTWGKLISTTGTLASTVGVKNPYRYRGYRYDGETGLYYLNARYYNAEWGRFINADAAVGSIGELISHNMFVYCLNNPVNMSDPSGNWPSFSNIIKAAKKVINTFVNVITRIVAVATVVVAVATVVSTIIGVNNSVQKPIVNAKMRELKKGWSYRRDKGGVATREKEHVHVEGGGKKYQQDVDGGRRKLENPYGLPSPPRKIRDLLKEKEGWDWDANELKRNLNKVVAGGATYLVYRGIRMAPSLAPPLWWTIPANAVAP
ncbi:putative cell wall associated protein [Clostridium pasteurianum DSM 525 = ATCC 6013]|nr:putative cell wall associated protein [Clostridium pasteurianum DSM 525 = ATCC 6013]